MINDSSTAEVFCGNCGMVVTDKEVDQGPEWRSFTGDEKNNARAGRRTTLTRHDQGLSTMIGIVNKDSSGKPLSTSMKNSIERLRTWDSRSQARNTVDRNLKIALSEIDKLKDKLALTDAVIEKAAYIYRKAMEKKLVRGRSINGMVAACLYAACRDTETPRSLGEVATGINIRRKEIAKCYRLIFKELELKMPVADPIKVVAKIASRSRLDEKSKRQAIKILIQAKECGISAGKDPMGIAAAALYLAASMTGTSVSQKEISYASGVTEVTIRNRCAGLKKMLSRDVKGRFKDVVGGNKV